MISKGGTSFQLSHIGRAPPRGRDVFDEGGAIGYKGERIEPESILES